MEFLIGLIAALIAIPFRGFVLAQLWAWFVVPQFHPAPLRIPVVLGLACMLECVKGSSPKNYKETSFTELITYNLCESGVALLMGWVYSLFL